MDGERERDREKNEHMETLNSRQSSQSIKEFSSIVFLQLNDRSIKVVKRSSCLYSVCRMLKSLGEFTVEQERERERERERAVINYLQRPLNQTDVSTASRENALSKMYPCSEKLLP